MPTNLFINTNADSPGQAAVRSEIAPTPVVVPAVVKGDVNDYNISLVDGNGNFDTATAVDISKLSVAVGPLGAAPYTTEVTNWSYAADIFSGFIDFNTATLATALGDASELDAYIAVEGITISTSHAHTFLQQPIKILNRVAP